MFALLQDNAGRFLVVLSAFLIIFGSFNMISNSFAQEPGACLDGMGNKITCPKPTDILVQNILERLIGEIGPIVGGMVAIGIQFARKQGLRISAEAEEYFVSMAGTFVEDQTRKIYEEAKRNNWKLPEGYRQKAFADIRQKLLTELQSDEFTKTAKQMLSDNLEFLINNKLTEIQKQMAQRIQNVLSVVSSNAVDAILLYKDNTKALSNDDKKTIVDDAVKRVRTHLDSEYLITSDSKIQTYVEAELKRKIGP